MHDAECPSLNRLWEDKQILRYDSIYHSMNYIVDGRIEVNQDEFQQSAHAPPVSLSFPPPP